MLHDSIGLVKDMYINLTNDVKTDLVNGKSLNIACDNFIKTFKIPIQEYY